MKNFILILASLLFLVSCDKESTSNLNHIKENLKTDNLSTNEFVLKNDTVIAGKLGTEVLIPQDLFENYKKGKIKMELKEFYSKEDMILNSLSTVTDKDELLESSGMLYLNFTEEGKQLIIKKGKNYKVILPEEVLENSNIYSNNNDSIFKWKLDSEQLKISFPDVIKNYQYRISVDKTGKGGFFKETIADSLKIVQKNDSLKLVEIISKNLKSDVLTDFEYSALKNINYLYEVESNILTFSFSKLNWINIDKLVDFEIEKNFHFKVDSKFKEYLINIIYLDSKSFINEYFISENNKLNVKIKGKIKIVIYTNDNKNIYYDTFYIDKNSKTDFEVNLKETSLDRLKQILITP